MEFNVKKFSWTLVLVLFLLFLGSTSIRSFSVTGEMIPTQNDLILLIAFVLLALIFSFLCSIAEAVLLSITPAYIEGLREKHPRRSELLKQLRQDRVDQSLAAILTLNTIAHTVGAVVAGSKAAVVFGSDWVGLFSAVLTLIILFLTEIVPKTIGAVYWSSLSGITGIFIHTLIRVLYPLVWLSEGLTKLIASGKVMHVFSREEFVAMAGVGEQTGHIDKQESRIIRNIFRFDSLKSTDIMTPRTVISALPQDMSVTEALEKAIQMPFSRLPIYRNNIDDITGFVLKDEILMYKLKNRDHVTLESIKRHIISVLEDMPLSSLLAFFLERRQHIALVVDEYGGTRGVVTLEDVIETLVGMEITDEMDKVTDMRVLARQQWKKRAKALGIEIDLLEKEKPISPT